MRLPHAPQGRQQPRLVGDVEVEALGEARAVRVVVVRLEDAARELRIHLALRGGRAGLAELPLYVGRNPERRRKAAEARWRDRESLLLDGRCVRGRRIA